MPIPAGIIQPMNALERYCAPRASTELVIPWEDRMGTPCSLPAPKSPHTEPKHVTQVDGSSYGQLAGQRRKVQLMKAYRFVLGAENTVQVDYVTEKFWQLFGSGWGVPTPSP